MTITWMGHACFLLESGGYRVLLDPFKGVRGYPDTAARADAVYCSHGHFDHAYTDEVTLTAGGASPFTIREVDTFHDDQGGAARGRAADSRGRNLYPGRRRGQGGGGPAEAPGGDPHALPGGGQGPGGAGHGG